MARAAVIMYRCDGCKTTGEPEPYPTNSKVPIRLRKEWVPADWVELRATGNKGEVLNMHLCPDCLSEASRLLMGMTLDTKDVEGLGLKPLTEESETWELHKKKEEE